MTAPTHSEVLHNTASHRFEFHRGDVVAVLDYAINDRQMAMTHTYVPEDFRGQGIAEKLVRAALAEARTRQYKVVPECSYVAKFIARHAEFQDLLAE